MGGHRVSVGVTHLAMRHEYVLELRNSTSTVYGESRTPESTARAKLA